MIAVEMTKTPDVVQLLKARGAGGVHVIRGRAGVLVAGAMHVQGERRRDDAVRGEFQLLGGGELEDK